MAKPLEIAGRRFGQSVVIRRLEERTKAGKTVWECRCDCGSVFNTIGSALVSGNTRSCGCIKLERAAEMGRAKRQYCDEVLKHRERWRAMIRRCHDPRVREYKNYGARGIQVCERWRNSLHAFVEDMGQPKAGQTIDRIDVNGNYEPGNCRWADSESQARNKRSNRLLTFNGQTMCISDWARELGVGKSLIRERLQAGWPIERVLKTN